ncbi:MAG: DUF4912 domain-containing protein [bacterium]
MKEKKPVKKIEKKVKEKAEKKVTAKLKAKKAEVKIIKPAKLKTEKKEKVIIPKKKKAISVKPETFQETQAEIEASKFYPPQLKENSKKQMHIPDFAKREEDTIPHRYHDNRLVLMARDAFWCYAYWDLKTEFVAQKKQTLKPEWGVSHLCIRLYDITNISFNGKNAHSFRDIYVSPDSDNWYLNVWKAGCTYLVDLGLKTISGNFVTLLRSNAVGTPSEKTSQVKGEQWMEVDSHFEEIFRMSGGVKNEVKPIGASDTVGRSSDLSFGSDTVSSFSLAPEVEKNKDFFLKVNTELILNGITKKDAQVTVKNEKVQLREDGSFTLHYKLVDGEVLLPVTAVSADKTDSITIKITVERKTE